MTSTRHGVAAKELQRQIGCTYKTAWRMAHELRKLMAQADNYKMLSGHVEVDETFIGGHQSHQKARKRGSNKSIVMGLKERNGIVRAAPVKHKFKFQYLEDFIFTNVEIGSTLSTDEGYSRERLGTVYKHGRVNHHEKEYVNGIHHTNSLEGHWSLLKRSIRGTHVHVSPKHLWKYVCEFSYRHNMRESHAAMFHQLVASFSLPRLTES
jgi:hypothetical protein